MYVEKLITDAILQTLENVEIAFIAEIITFNRIKMRAKIRPLLKYRTSDNKELFVPDFDDVPVELLYAGGAYIRPDYAKGDLVHVSCYGSAIRAALEKQRVVNSELKHQISYCTVTSGILPKNFSSPAVWSNKTGLLIGKGNNFIRLTDSQIEIQGDVTIAGKLTVNEDIETPKNIKSTSLLGDVSATGPTGVISLKNHKHIASGPGAPTGPAIP